MHFYYHLSYFGKELYNVNTASIEFNKTKEITVGQIDLHYKQSDIKSKRAQWCSG